MGHVTTASPAAVLANLGALLAQCADRRASLERDRPDLRRVTFPWMRYGREYYLLDQRRGGLVKGTLGPHETMIRKGLVLHTKYRDYHIPFDFQNFYEKRHV